MSQSRSRRKGLILTIVIALAVVGVTIGLRLWVYQNIHIPLQHRAAAITAELKASGARVGEPQVVNDVPGVEQAVTLDVDGQPIRLLEFDASIEEQAKELRHIHEEHTTRVFGGARPAEDDGNIIIIDFENHPRKDEILRSFRKK